MSPEWTHMAHGTAPQHVLRCVLSFSLLLVPPRAAALHLPLPRGGVLHLLLEEEDQLPPLVVLVEDDVVAVGPVDGVALLGVLHHLPGHVGDVEVRGAGGGEGVEDGDDAIEHACSF